MPVIGCAKTAVAVNRKSATTTIRATAAICTASPVRSAISIKNAFAAAISSGNYWPNGKRAPVGNVLIWTSEDNLRDTIKPRLVQMGADLSRIDAVTQQFDGKGKLRPFNRQPIC